METDPASAEGEAHAALDYRAQMQARYGSKRKPLIDAFHERRAELELHLLKVFPDMTIDDIESMLGRSEKETDSDDGLLHAALLDNKALVEAAATSLGYDLHGGVSAGILNSHDLEAMQQPVFMTAASVILITEKLGLLRVWLSKLLAKTIPFERLEEGFRPESDISLTAKRLASDPELQAHWNWFFYLHALFPHEQVRHPILMSESKEENTFWGDLSEAMDLFVLSHEYGHHLARHSVGGELSVEGEDVLTSHAKELEADRIAAQLCAMAGASLKGSANYFAVSNTGAVCILYVLELIRRARGILETGFDSGIDMRPTHPPSKYRIEMVRRTVGQLFGESSAGLLAMQDLFVDVLSLIWTHVSGQLVQRHEAGDRPDANGSHDWLPL